MPGEAVVGVIENVARVAGKAAETGAKVASVAGESSGTGAKVVEGASEASKAAANVVEKGSEGVGSVVQNAAGAAESKGIGPDSKPPVSSEKDLEARVAEQRDETAEVDAKNAKEVKKSTHSEEFYRQVAKAELSKGLSKEIKDDPQFKGEIDKVRADAQQRGKSITPGEVEEEALANYLKSKDSAKESPEQDQLFSMLQDALKDMKIKDLDKIETTLKFMTPEEQAILLAMLEKRKKEEKEKEPLLKLILKLLAIIGMSAVFDVAPKVTASPRQ